LWKLGLKGWWFLIMIMIIIMGHEWGKRACGGINGRKDRYWGVKRIKSCDSPSYY
jgi:hypothetical protein